MSPIETRKIFSPGHIPLGKWRTASPGETLYQSRKENPFRSTVDYSNVGRTHLRTVRVGDDGESVILEGEVLDAPISHVNRMSHPLTHTRTVTVASAEFQDHDGKGSVQTDNPFIDIQVRYKPR